MKKGLNFIAIDFETATGKRASVCEVGICVIKDGTVQETKSWLAKKEYEKSNHSTPILPSSEFENSHSTIRSYVCYLFLQKYLVSLPKAGRMM